MAYLSQDGKRVIVARCKPILKKYGMRATFGVRDHSSFQCTIRGGTIDWDKYSLEEGRNGWQKPNLRHPKTGQYDFQVNHYWIDTYWEGRALNFLRELTTAINADNHDNSRSEIDYFDVGYYVDIRVKDYKVE